MSKKILIKLVALVLFAGLIGTSAYFGFAKYNNLSAQADTAVNTYQSIRKANEEKQKNAERPEEKYEPPKELEKPAETSKVVPKEPEAQGQPETEPQPEPQPEQQEQPPAASSGPIEIVGDESCVNDTNEALNRLKNQALEHYQMVTTYIGVIECVDKGSGMQAWANPPRYKVGDETRKAWGNIWYASTIVHDATHSKLYHEGKPWTGRDAEETCLLAQQDALRKIGGDPWIADNLLNLLDTNYWDVPEEERWW